MQEKNRKKTGTEYEQKAGLYLEQHGYRILMFNYRCRFGEIDIVAREGSVFVFCEVKYRTTAQKGTPLEAVTARKQKTISKCALSYLTQRGLEGVQCRFDVIGIEGDRAAVTLIRNAFDYKE